MISSKVDLNGGHAAPLANGGVESSNKDSFEMTLAKADVESSTVSSSDYAGENQSILRVSFFDLFLMFKGSDLTCFREGNITRIFGWAGFSADFYYGNIPNDDLGRNIGICKITLPPTCMDSRIYL